MGHVRAPAGFHPRAAVLPACARRRRAPGHGRGGEDDLEGRGWGPESHQGAGVLRERRQSKLAGRAQRTRVHVLLRRQRPQKRDDGVVVFPTRRRLGERRRLRQRGADAPRGSGRGEERHRRARTLRTVRADEPRQLYVPGGHHRGVGGDGRQSRVRESRGEIPRRRRIGRVDRAARRGTQSAPRGRYRHRAVDVR